MSNNLIQELRTDKNGVTKRVWVKPQQAASSSDSAIPKVRSMRAAPETRRVVIAAIKEYGLMVDSGIAMLETATEEETAVIAEAIGNYGEDYVESMLQSAFMGKGAIDIANLAVVYDPETYKDFKGKLRDNIILKAIERSCVEAGCGDPYKSLMDKSPEIIERTRTYIRFMDAVDQVKAPRHTKELIALGMGDTGRDPQDVLDVVRQHRVFVPGQIEFILDGGNPVLHDGAL
jgi:hypothetical protein